MKWSYVVLIKFETKYLFTTEKFKTSNVKIYCIFTAPPTDIIVSPFQDFITMSTLGTTTCLAFEIC